LHGKRIAVAGARRFEELDTLVRKLGGEAVLRPMMRSAPLDDPSVTAAALRLCERGCDWIVLVTGVGTRALLEVAGKLGKEEALLGHMRGARIAARGYKTVKALKDLGLKPLVKDDDGTVEGLKRTLALYPFAGARVSVQLHGERMPELTDWLLAEGAEVLEIPLYRYLPPSEAEVAGFVRELLGGDLDAVAFTSNTQVRYLFGVAETLGHARALRDAFNGPVVVASVGSMTTAALHDAGVARVIAPAHERMGAMMVTLADHYGQRTAYDIGT